MLFNSIDFAIFLPLVFMAYWLIPARHIRAQNILIVLASYVFYGWWDWRFLSLIVFSTIVDYVVGRRLAEENRPVRRKFLLWVSIAETWGSLDSLNTTISSWRILWRRSAFSGNLSKPTSCISFYQLELVSTPFKRLVIQLMYTEESSNLPTILSPLPPL